MTNILRISVLDKKPAGYYPDWFDCDKCGKAFHEDGHYVSYGPKYGEKRYHLVCFNKHIKKMIKKWELMDKNMNDSLNKLNTMIKDITLDLT